MRPEEAGAPGEGRALHDLATELFPIGRSITGEGVRRTLRRLADEIPLELREVPTGTAVLDWTVPREWNVREAWIEDPSGRRVVDWEDHTLHLVGYSVPVDREMTLEELRPHLHTLPDQPDRIPYRTSYWSETWGFCLRHRDLEALPGEGRYRVRIDSTLAEGSLTYGECLLEGSGDGEVLLSCHICHPSLANDNLSGMVVATGLARWLLDRPRRHAYRFLFIPGTIGSVTWLARNEEAVSTIRHGMVLAGVGDPGPLTWKRSRRGDATVDRAVEHVLRHRQAGEPRVEDFSPYGYDERQYGSPGFDLPVGCLMRTPWGRYPEYHTSGDDLDFVGPEPLADALEACREVVEVLEGNATCLNLAPRGEPQLGRRGLYGSLGGPGRDREGDLMAVLWVLNQSDGAADLLAVAEKAGLPFRRIRWAADRLLDVGLLEEVPEVRERPEARARAMTSTEETR